jgi:hypothetical protein
MRVLSSLLGGMLVLVTCTANAADLQRWIDAPLQGGGPAATGVVRLPAGDGGAATQNHLTAVYIKDQGNPDDYAQIFASSSKAARDGNAEAEDILGTLYFKGHGIPRDYEQALAWYRRAAAQSNADAEFNLGTMYANGTFVKQSYTRAVEWYQRAAAHGNADAQNNLGLMYSQGYGVLQGDADALSWFGKSASQGNAIAKSNFALMKFFAENRRPARPNSGADIAYEPEVIDRKPVEADSTPAHLIDSLLAFTGILGIFGLFAIAIGHLVNRMVNDPRSGKKG